MQALLPTPVSETNCTVDPDNAPPGVLPEPVCGVAQIQGTRYIQRLLENLGWLDVASPISPGA